MRNATIGRIRAYLNAQTCVKNIVTWEQLQVICNMEGVNIVCIGASAEILNTMWYIVETARHGQISIYLKGDK